MSGCSCVEVGEPLWELVLFIYRVDQTRQQAPQPAEPSYQPFVLLLNLGQGFSTSIPIASSIIVPHDTLYRSPSQLLKLLSFPASYDTDIYGSHGFSVSVGCGHCLHSSSTDMPHSWLLPTTSLLNSHSLYTACKDSEPITHVLALHPFLWNLGRNFGDPRTLIFLFLSYILIFVSLSSETWSQQYVCFFCALGQAHSKWSLKNMSCSGEKESP